MSTHFQKCENCGATLDVATTGAASCPYCGAGVTRAVDPGSLAASMRSEMASIEQFFHHMAQKLAKEFPSHTKVETSGGFFSTPKVVAFEVSLGNEILAMRQDGPHIVGSRKKIVRGIALKNETLSIDAWIDALCAGLAAVANESQAAHAALQRLSGR